MIAEFKLLVAVKQSKVGWIEGLADRKAWGKTIGVKACSSHGNTLFRPSYERTCCRDNWWLTDSSYITFESIAVFPPGHASPWRTLRQWLGMAEWLVRDYYCLLWDSSNGQSLLGYPQSPLSKTFLGLHCSKRLFLLNLSFTSVRPWFQSYSHLFLRLPPLPSIGDSPIKYLACLIPS